MYNHVHRADKGKRERSSKEIEYRKELYVRIYTHTQTHTHTYMHTRQLQQLRKITACRCNGAYTHFTVY